MRVSRFSLVTRKRKNRKVNELRLVHVADNLAATRMSEHNTVTPIDVGPAGGGLSWPQP